LTVRGRKRTVSGGGGPVTKGGPRSSRRLKDITYYNRKNEQGVANAEKHQGHLREAGCGRFLAFRRGGMRYSNHRIGGAEGAQLRNNLSKTVWGPQRLRVRKGKVWIKRKGAPRRRARKGGCFGTGIRDRGNGAGGLE